uniref:semaphorin-3D n=1 Tax=Doryrhamphus excisus TaxID=161450 RepID=UPI0025AE6435|nr:semaphorin-3D [Doryrhamphus excisus]XP_057911298.1 semaphorin-3D [Doryrhamphus excisus]
MRSQSKMKTMLWLLPLATLMATASDLPLPMEPRLQLPYEALKNGSAVYWGGGATGGVPVLLLDEDQGWLLVGGKDHVHLLRSDSVDLPWQTVHWPAAQRDVQHCLMIGKSLQSECANFVRLLQPFNKTHVYVCATGAFNPQCGLLHVNLHTPEALSLLSHTVVSGRGKCPYSPREPFTARLSDTDVYAGTSVDFMGTNAAIFRTSIQGAGRHLRTEAYDHNWLNVPEFVGSFSIPDTHHPDDDKIYFFFREAAVEADQWDHKVYSRVARVCKNDAGGRRSLINRWTTFLKARLVCSVPGPSGVHTHFDQLEDVFVLETKDPQNPIIYGVFRTSSSLFRGSAVCVFPMSSIRAAFNGPFAHKEGPDYRWVEYKGRIPYPRPGACPSETNDALHESTQDFPDEVVSFMRQHQLMWEPVLPLGGRPVFTQVNVSYMLTRVVVDRLDTEDATYHVLFLGTDDGKVLKVVSEVKDTSEIDAIFLEALTVFQSPAAIHSMKISSKKQQLYVSSKGGVAQLALQRCELYGADCSDCRLARDPYCIWDGQTCSRFFASSKRRARTQDTTYGETWSHCPITDGPWNSVEVKVVYGVEGNTSFMECVPRSPQAELRWTLQQQNEGSHVLRSCNDERHIHTKRGLLVQRLQLSDDGVYTCSGSELSYSRVVSRFRLHVIPAHRLLPGARGGPNRQPPVPAAAAAALPAISKDQKIVEYCQQMWFREKRRQNKVFTLKLKHDSRKSRVRRNESRF